MSSRMLFSTVAAAIISAAAPAYGAPSAYFVQRQSTKTECRCHDGTHRVSVAEKRAPERKPASDTKAAGEERRGVGADPTNRLQDFGG